MEIEQENGNSEEWINLQGSFSVTEEEVEPPFFELESEFPSLQDWLLYICKEQPNVSIATFKIGLFEEENDFILFLVGVNSYEEPNNTLIRIEFEPEKMYFKLPESYYETSHREELLSKIANDLRAFTETESFKSSFFTASNVIIFETNGQKIWSR